METIINTFFIGLGLAAIVAAFDLIHMVSIVIH
jgi:hypothetical protein